IVSAADCRAREGDLGRLHKTVVVDPPRTRFSQKLAAGVAQRLTLEPKGDSREVDAGRARGSGHAHGRARQGAQHERPAVAGSTVDPGCYPRGLPDVQVARNRKMTALEATDERDEARTDPALSRKRAQRVKPPNDLLIEQDVAKQ